MTKIFLDLQIQCYSRTKIPVFRKSLTMMSVNQVCTSLSNLLRAVKSRNEETNPPNNACSINTRTHIQVSIHFNKSFCSFSFFLLLCMYSFRTWNTIYQYLIKYFWEGDFSLCQETCVSVFLSTILFNYRGRHYIFLEIHGGAYSFDHSNTQTKLGLWRFWFKKWQEVWNALSFFFSA